jgi:predicted methyltransferase
MRQRSRCRPHRRINGLVALFSLATAIAGCATPPANDPAAMPGRNTQVIASPSRTEQDRKIDAARHPAEFLAFAQARPGMKVLDVSAGAGYTSQLLALAVLPGGIVYAQTPRASPALTKRLADHPQSDLVLVERPFDDPVPGDAPPLDLVTIVNNYHDISYLPIDRAKMNSRIFAALKPGGHYVVIDHAARSGTGTSDGKTLHRIDEAVVRHELAQAGFVLDAEGDFLRNPSDARDQPSVGSAVPTDRFALRFVKPK